MSGNTTGIWFVALAACGLLVHSRSVCRVGACAGGVCRLPSSRTTAVSAPASEAVAQTTALIYEWDTQYSAFLSPPIEVRRQAKNDCVAEGYEIAVVETLKLDGNVATAVFICRGDFE